MGPGEELDEWQVQLCRAIMELYPDDYEIEALRGKLRYRDGCLVLVPRQVGKTTVIGALEFVSFLRSVATPGARTEMGVIAQKTENANVLFNRFKMPMINIPALEKRFKVTGYRGVFPRDKKVQAQFKVHASDISEKLQSIPFNSEGGVALCLDELHLQKAETYSALKLGLKAQKNTLMVSISTAGDENSDLLHSLEAYGKEAIEGQHERFGFFKWYAPDHLDPYSDEAILTANPAVACGRLPVDEAIDKTIPLHEYTRYCLNRTGQSENVFMPAHLWNQCAGEMPPLADMKRPVFALERTDNWEYVTVTASKKIDGVVYSQMIAQFKEPEHVFLVQVCKQLYSLYGGSFVMDAVRLRALHTDLREKQHIPLEYFNQQQIAEATSVVYALATTERLVHAGDEVITNQRPHALTKTLGDGYRLSQEESTADIDALKATVIGAYWAEVNERNVPTAVSI